MADENAYGPKELRETKLDSDEEENTVEDKEGTKFSYLLAHFLTRLLACSLTHSLFICSFIL